MCRVRKFPGQTELTMSAEVELISTMVEKKSWTRAPIQMEFQVCGSFHTYQCKVDLRIESSNFCIPEIRDPSLSIGLVH